jgi:HD superfamily phosphohydrolase
VDLIKCAAPRTVYCDVLSSQLDADRLDYLLRDNLMTGSQYGNYDLGWLLHALTIDEASNRLAVVPKGVSAVEAYLQSRFHMYRNVYFHKVVRSAEAMVKLSLQRARMLAERGQLNWPGDDDPVCKALLGVALSHEQFLELDDTSIQQAFKIWSKSGDAILAELCGGLVERRVFKTIDLSAIDDRARVDRVVSAVGAAIASAGGSREYEACYDEPAQTPYETYDGRGDAGEILVRMNDGTLKEFASISPLSRALNQQLMFRRLHVAPRWRELAEDVVKRT